MVESVSPHRGMPAPDGLEAQFLGVLPRIVTHAQIAFRGVRCPSRKEDLISETLGLCWAWYRRLAARGRDPRQFVSALATFAARAARSGRRLAGQESGNDVLSERAQARHGFTVERLPATLTAPYEQLYGAVGGQRLHDVFEERLRDNRTTPILDQVQFKIDFGAWLATLTARERRLIRAMAGNERTKDIARQFGVSPGRVSQFRRAFERGWGRFCGDGEPAAGVAVA
jgi:hypothetical protein